MFTSESWIFKNRVENVLTHSFLLVCDEFGYLYQVIIRIKFRFIFISFVLFFFYKSSSSLWSSKWMASTGFWRTLPMNDCYSYTTVQNKISTQQLSVVIIRLILSEACNRQWIFKIILKHIWHVVKRLPMMRKRLNLSKVPLHVDNIWVNDGRMLMMMTIIMIRKKKVTRMKMKRRL